MILVVGSLNLDIVTRVERIPAPGETVLGLGKSEHFGGKGANEAVCIARLGGKVSMVGALGDDQEGTRILKRLQQEQVDSTLVSTKPTKQTGIAIVTVDATSGENTVIVVPGANFALEVEDLPKDFTRFAWVMCQNEIPIEVTLEAFRRAKLARCKTFWNPAPAPTTKQQDDVVNKVLKFVDILCVNETEAVICSGGMQNLDEAVQCLNGMVPDVVVTLGKQGCIWKSSHQRAAAAAKRFPAAPCAKAVVDTTGAGDCFCGSLVWRLSQGDELPDAIPVANRIAALSVQKHGAQTSYPRFDEI